MALWNLSQGVKEKLLRTISDWGLVTEIFHSSNHAGNRFNGGNLCFTLLEGRVIVSVEAQCTQPVNYSSSGQFRKAIS